MAEWLGKKLWRNGNSLFRNLEYLLEEIFNNYLLEMRFKYLPSSKFIRNYKLINLINSETFYFFLKCIYTRKRELKPSLS